MSRSELGAVLWELLPAVYRARDARGPAARRPRRGEEELGDLGLFLDAAGTLLDSIRATLDQRLADCFPDEPLDGSRPSQPWLLPYFGRLVDARLHSPHVEGRRREVAEAISWRQRKGTLGAAEAIAEAAGGRALSGLGGREVELQEGLRLVATTARVDRGPAGRLAVAPGTTVAVDEPMRAVRVAADSPVARSSSFGGDQRVSWALAYPEGVPCFPGHYDDASRCTVDLRAPGPRAGHAHPKRLVIHAAPPLGFFGAKPPPRRGAPAGTPRIEALERTGDEEQPLENAHVGTLHLRGGRVNLVDCVVDNVVADGPPPAEGPQVRASGSLLGGIVASGAIRLRDCTLTGPAQGTLISASDCLADAAGEAPLLVGSELVRLRHCAVQRLDTVELQATGSLVGAATVSGRAVLEYVTVLGELTVSRLLASDCLLAGSLTFSAAQPRGCLRYSRVPPGTTGGAQLPTFALTSAVPLFLDARVCGPEPVSAFARPGSGVLDPATPDTIRFGAEDGGELGAYHDAAHSLEQVALVEQVTDHLPHGMRAVLVLDPRLHQVPPAVPDPTAPR